MAALRGGLDLLGIVRMSEEIKQVVKVAFRINIMALNAIFLAKRAGTSALGFAVLSNELRVFSQDLHGQMQVLSDLVGGLVKVVSELLQDLRYARLLGAAARMAASPGMAAESLARRREITRRDAQHFADLRRRLGTALDDAFRLAEMGRILASSAKIEAAYGQDFAPSLAQVSGDFHQVVEEILVSLENLRKSGFWSSGALEEWR